MSDGYPPDPDADEGRDRQDPPHPISEAERSARGASDSVQAILDAAERHANQIRSEAETQAREYVTEIERRADRIATERMRNISSLTDGLAEQASVVRHQTEQMVDALETAITEINKRLAESERLAVDAHERDVREAWFELEGSPAIADDSQRPRIEAEPARAAPSQGERSSRDPIVEYQIPPPPSRPEDSLRPPAPSIAKSEYQEVTAETPYWRKTTSLPQDSTDADRTQAHDPNPGSADSYQADSPPAQPPAFGVPRAKPGFEIDDLLDRPEPAPAGQPEAGPTTWPPQSATTGAADSPAEQDLGRDPRPDASPPPIPRIRPKNPPELRAVESLPTPAPAAGGEDPALPSEGSFDDPPTSPVEQVQNQESEQALEPEAPQDQDRGEVAPAPDKPRRPRLFGRRKAKREAAAAVKAERAQEPRTDPSGYQIPTSIEDLAERIQESRDPSAPLVRVAGSTVVSGPPEEALVKATQLAVAGSDRDEIKRVLRRDFGILDPTEILDRIVGNDE